MPRRHTQFEPSTTPSARAAATRNGSGARDATAGGPAGVVGRSGGPRRRAARVAFAALFALGAAFVVAACVPPGGCDVEWVGASAGDWATDANWSTGVAPTAGQRVCVASGFAVDLAGPAAAGAVRVDGSLTVAPAGELEVGSLEASSIAALQLRGRLAGVGTVTVSSGSLAGGTVSGSATVRVPGTAATEVDGVTLHDSAWVALLDGEFSGTVTACDTSTVDVTGATVVSTAATVTTAGCLPPASPSFTVAGTGSLRIDGALTLYGVVLINRGTVSGVGELNGTLNGGGAVEPGGVGSIGVLTVNGAFQPGSGMHLGIDVVGPGQGVGYDALRVNGLANVSDVQLILNEVTPVVGLVDAKVVDATSRVGNVAMVTVPAKVGTIWEVSSDKTTGVRAVLSPFSLSSSPNPSVPGTPISLNLQVPVETGTPTTPVTFREGGAVVATVVPGAGGVATYSTGPLAGGAYTYTASFPGDATRGAATANPYVHSVCGGPPAPGVNWSGCDLHGVDVRGADLHGADLIGADLTDARLDGANLSGAHLDLADLTRTRVDGANLTGATLTTARLSQTVLAGADLSGAHLDEAEVLDADLTGTNLTATTLTRIRSVGLTTSPIGLDPAWRIVNGLLVGPTADLRLGAFTDTDLSGLDLTDADLTAVDLLRANLGGSTLTGADLTDAWLGGIHSGGIIGQPAHLPSGWGLQFGFLVGTGADLRGADLTGADLAGLILSGADLTDARITGANLSGTSLAGAVFTRTRSGGIIGTPLNGHVRNGYLLEPGVDLIGADLHGATLANLDLHDADLTDARLDGSDISGSDVTDADLTGADLTGVVGQGAIFSRSVLISANLTGANLSGASLVDAHLEHATLDAAVVLGADLNGAQLTDASLVGASFKSSNLSGAALGGAVVTSVNFTYATFLSTTGVPVDAELAEYGNTTCTDGTNSDTNPDGSCALHFS